MKKLVQTLRNAAMFAEVDRFPELYNYIKDEEQALMVRDFLTDDEMLAFIHTDQEVQRTFLWIMAEFFEENDDVVHVEDIQALP